MVHSTITAVLDSVVKRTGRELKLELSSLGNKTKLNLMPSTTQRDLKKVKEGESTAKRSSGDPWMWLFNPKNGLF